MFGRIKALKMAPDGERLITAGIDGVVHVRRITQEIPSEEVVRLAFLPNEELLAVYKDRRVVEIDPQTGARTSRFRPEDRLGLAAIRDDGRALAIANGPVISLWDTDSGTQLHPNIGRNTVRWEENIHALEFQPNGGLLAVATPYWAYALDTKSFQLKGRFPCFRTDAISASPDGKLMAVPHGNPSGSGDAEKYVRLYAIETGVLVDTIHHTDGRFHAITFTSDSKRVASAGSERIICVTDIGVGVGVAGSEMRLRGHTDAVTSLAFSPDGKLLVSGARDGTIRFWSVDRQEAIAIASTESRTITTLDFSPDGKILAAAGDAGIDLFFSETAREIEHHIATDRLLADGDWPGLYKHFAEQNGQPELIANSIDDYFQNTVELVTSQKLPEALTQIDRAIEVLQRVKVLDPEARSRVLDTPMEYRLSMTKAGICFKMGRIDEFEEICSALESPSNPEAIYAWKDDNWAQRLAESEYRRRLILRVDPMNRDAAFLRLFMLYQGNVRIRKSDGSTDTLSWRDREIPDEPFEITAVGALVDSLTDLDFEWLGKQSTLESLTVSFEHGFNATQHRVWDGLSTLSHLQVLDLRGWAGRTEDEFQQLAKLRRLTQLSLDSAFVGFEHLRHLERLPELEHLQIHGSWLSTDDLKQLTSLPKLKVLSLSWCVLDDEGMAVIASLKQLEALFIDGTSVTEAGLKSLEGHPSLRRLDIFDVPVADAAAASLEKIPTLEIAGLINTAVSRLGLERLREALPNCLVMHNAGYLNVGKDFEGEMVVGSAPPETMYFPPLSSMAKLLSEKATQARDSSNVEESTRAYEILGRIAADAAAGKHSATAATYLHKLPSAFDRFDRSQVAAALPYMKPDEIPIELVSVIGNDRLNFVRSGRALVSFDNSRDELVAVQNDGLVHRFDKTTGDCKSVTGGIAGLRTLSRTGRRALSIDGGVAKVWNTNNAEVTVEFPAANDSVFGFSADAQRVLIGTSDGTLEVVSLSDPSERITLREGDGAPVLAVRTDPTGQVWAARNDNGNVLVLDAAIGNQLSEFQIELGNDRRQMRELLSLSAGGDRVAIGNKESIGQVSIWDRENETILWQFCPAEILNRGNTRSNAVALSPDGTLLATQDEGGVVAFWSVDEKKLLGQLQDRTSWISALMFDEPGRTLAVTDERGLSLVDPKRRTLTHRPEMIGAVSSLQVAVDSSQVVVGAQNGIHLYDVAKVKRATSLAGYFPQTIYGISQDGLLLYGDNRAIHFLDPTTDTTSRSHQFDRRGGVLSVLVRGCLMPWNRASGESFARNLKKSTRFWVSYAWLRRPTLYPIELRGRVADYRSGRAGASRSCSARHSTHTTATLTQLIGGSESNTHSHSSPPSRPSQSWPVVVPK